MGKLSGKNQGICFTKLSGHPVCDMSEWYGSLWYVWQRDMLVCDMSDSVIWQSLICLRAWYGSQVQIEHPLWRPAKCLSHKYVHRQRLTNQQIEAEAEIQLYT